MTQSLGKPVYDKFINRSTKIFLFFIFQKKKKRKKKKKKEEDESVKLKHQTTLRRASFSFLPTFDFFTPTGPLSTTVHDSPLPFKRKRTSNREKDFDFLLYALGRQVIEAN